MAQTEQEKIASLENQLFHAKQYREAIISDAICYYKANLTKDLIDKELTYKNAEGKVLPLLKLVDLSAPCKFSEFIGRWVAKAIDPAYVQKYGIFQNTKDFLIDCFNRGKQDYIIEYWYKNEKGMEFFLSQRFLLAKDEYGDICTFAVLNNATQAKKTEALQHRDELERHAYTDPITGGFNYIRFKKELHEMNRPGAIIAMDLQAFKLINTICGIRIGDNVIRALWKRLIEVFDYDKGEYAAHINADNFIIFCPSDDQEEIVTKIKSVSYSLNMISAELSVPLLKANFGISKWLPNKTVELAYSEAVTAKNNSKTLQNYNYAFFEKADMDRLVREKSILDGFEDAMAQNEFQIWYQPKYDPATKTITGAEALVRWVKDGDFYVSPGEFIPIFENNGIVRKFDEYIFRKVCMQQKKWLDEGKNICPVSVNISRVTLYYKDIFNIYSHIAESVGIEKKYVPIEITETAAMTNITFKGITESFINAGFTLHMDDFGSGYSSLSTVSSIQFSTWKLDKSMIDSIGSFKGERLIAHVIQLAKELGISIVAEGVETKEQNDFLAINGCESIQGFFYSKPIACPNFEKMIS